MTPRARRPRLRFPRRTGWVGLAAVLLVAAVTLLDRAGAFGRRGDDYANYHNRTFKVRHVADGDTLDLDVSDGSKSKTIVRLWGVDTPETVDPRQPVPSYFGLEASKFAKQLAEGRQVRVELVPDDFRDKYGRLLAYIYLPDGSMLNERLLEDGYGYADLRFAHPRMERFKSLEARARRQGRGLWQSVQPNQWPEWRQRMVPGKTATDVTDSHR